MADTEVEQRFRLALDMYEFGERMQRSRLRRHYPQAAGEQIDAMLRAWRESRPGAPHGDAAGRPSDRFA